MSLSVRESYDLIAKYFAVTRVFTWKWTDNFINTLANNCIILDIGSGNGRNSNYYNHIVFCIDISNEQLKMNNFKNNLSIHTNMISIPFKNNSFDSILSIASFHHLKTIEERHSCLKEMNRVLNKNGNILLSIWSINQPKKTKKNIF